MAQRRRLLSLKSNADSLFPSPVILLRGDGRTFSLIEWWMIAFPFAVHASWITAATIANGAIVTVANAWDVKNTVAFDNIGLSLIAMYAMYFGALKQCVPTLGTVCWALLAVSAGHGKDSGLANELQDPVSLAAMVLGIMAGAAAGMCLLLSAASFFGQKSLPSYISKPAAATDAELE